MTFTSSTISLLFATSMSSKLRMSYLLPSDNFLLFAAAPFKGLPKLVAGGFEPLAAKTRLIHFPL